MEPERTPAEMEQAIVGLARSIKALEDNDVHLAKLAEVQHQEIVKLQVDMIELSEAHKVHTRTLEAMVNTQERIMAQQTIAFRRITRLLVGLGADFEGSDIAELDEMFGLGLKPPDGDKGPEQN
jgi:hypothetical protein